MDLHARLCTHPVTTQKSLLPGGRICLSSIERMRSPEWLRAGERSGSGDTHVGASLLPGAESKQPPSQSCSRPISRVPPVGIVLPWLRTTDHSCVTNDTAQCRCPLKRCMRAPQMFARGSSLTLVLSCRCATALNGLSVSRLFTSSNLPAYTVAWHSKQNQPGLQFRCSALAHTNRWHHFHFHAQLVLQIPAWGTSSSCRHGTGILIRSKDKYASKSAWRKALPLPIHRKPCPTLWPLS